MNNYSYLEFDRNKALTTGECTLSLTTDQLGSFPKEYNQFISEIKIDDEEYGTTDEFFSKFNYPTFEEIISKKYNDYLTKILNDYLFVEFFSEILKTKSNELIFRVNSSKINNNQFEINCSYTSK